MKILFFAEFFPSIEKPVFTGGVEIRLYNIVKHLSKKNDVFVLTSRQRGMPEVEVEKNIHVYRLSKLEYTNSGNILKRLMLCYKLVKFGSRLKNIDLVEGGSFLMYIPSFFCAWLIGAKIKIITYHELWVGRWIKYKGLTTGILGEIWERITLRLPFDKIHVVSASIKEEITKRGISEDKIKIVKNGIDADFFIGVNHKNTHPTICYVGRLSKTKKVDTIIRAMPIIVKDFPDLECIICGGGEEQDNLQSIVNKLKLDKNVTFTGHLEEYKDVIEIMKKSHLFCHPSGVEGFGIVLVEAMACGTSIITSDIKPFKELNAENVGMMFSLGNYEELAECVIKSLKNKRELEKKSDLCIKKSRKYSWNNIVEYYNIYMN